MSLWQQKTGDAAHMERRKKALTCAVLSYLLFLVLVIISFMPAQKTVTIAVPAGGRQAVVRWSGRGGGTGRRHRRLLRGKGRVAGVKINRSKAVKETAKKPVTEKKIVVSAPPVKKVEKKVEKSGEKNKLKKSSKKNEKSAFVDEKVVAEKIEHKDTAKPIVTEKMVKKPVDKPADKPADKAVEKKREAQVKEEETLPEKEVGVPAASDVVEIEVGSEDIPADEAGDGDDFDDSDDGGDGEISRDEYALMCAVGRAWRPPRGLKPGLSARLIVGVSAQGRAERVDITTSSRVPAYDIAARASLYRAQYPPVFWGKNIAVVFGQT